MHNESLISKPMAIDKSKSTIDYLRMEPADNGVVITWTEKTKTPSKGTYDNCTYKDHKLVYDIDEEVDGGKTDIDKAFAKFRELWEKSYQEMKG